MLPLRFEFVPAGHPAYQQAVDLRYKIFFEPTGTSIDHLFDAQEGASEHVVALGPGDELAGYARFCDLGAGEGQISQLVVAPAWRGDLRVAHGLYDRVLGRAASNCLERLVADVRLPGVRAFQRYGFRPCGEPFPSPKTGILHQRMVFRLNGTGLLRIWWLP